MVQVKNKEPSKRAKLDMLIDFYEKHRPAAGQHIQLNVTPAKLAQILKYEVPKEKEPPRTQFYRSRTIIAIGVERQRKKKEDGEALPVQATI
jgi:hypothetical protein